MGSVVRERVRERGAVSKGEIVAKGGVRGYRVFLLGGHIGPKGGSRSLGRQRRAARLQGVSFVLEGREGMVGICPGVSGFHVVVFVLHLVSQ